MSVEWRCHIDVLSCLHLKPRNLSKAANVFAPRILCEKIIVDFRRSGMYILMSNFLNLHVNCVQKLFLVDLPRRPGHVLAASMSPLTPSRICRNPESYLSAELESILRGIHTKIWIELTMFRIFIGDCGIIFFCLLCIF